MRFFLLFCVTLFCAQPSLGRDYPEFRLLKMDGAHVKWGAAEYGAGAEVSYALVDAARDFPDARNCRSVGPVDPILAASGVDRNAFDAALVQAFGAWQSVSGIKFRPADDPQSADILIGSDLTAQGWAHADVKTETSDDGIVRIERSLVCLSPAKLWKIGFGANPDAQDIRYTLTHEIGHAIGLNHASPQGQVMSFTYGERFIELQAGDIEGAHRLYGPAKDTMIATIPDAAPVN
ncbi:matrixin family metalloprotease [Hyphococcus sp.]|uniref:matrixin family metalloprotease n=1 Tax=Hyphococcus sp. TaxID=2038636 RepID=UPI003CCB8E41